MKKLYVAALTYMIVGLFSGLFYRWYTKMNDFDGTTQLSVLHTHLLTLGMLFFLIMMALEKSFSLSDNSGKWFNLFFWHYNGGLILSEVMMLIIGIRDVAGAGENPALSGIAGLGHIIITVGLAFLFVSLNKAMKAAPLDTAPTD